MGSSISIGTIEKKEKRFSKQPNDSTCNASYSAYFELCEQNTILLFLLKFYIAKSCTMYKYNYNLRLKYNLYTQLFKIQAKLVIKYHQMIELNDMIG